MLERGAMLMLLTFLCVGCGDKADDDDRWSAPDFAPEALAARVRELIPVVEKVIGRPFGAPPAVTVLTPEKMAPRLARELVEFQARFENGPRGTALFKAMESQAKLLSRFLLGKVLLDDVAIAIVPDNFTRVAELAPEWHGVRSQEVLDVILVHELVHVHQLRELGLRKLLVGQETLDGFRSRGAVAEGHAQFVTSRAARAIGCTQAFELMVRTQTDAPSTAKSGLERTQARVMQAAIHFEYRDGHRLVEEVVEALGYEAAVRKLFGSPPATTGEVTRPRDYLVPREAHPFDLDRAARSIRRLLGETAENVRVAPVPLAALKAMVLPLGRDVADELPRHVRRAAAVVDMPRRVISVTTCTDAVSARWLARTNKAATDHVMASLPAGSEVLTNDVENVEVEGATALYLHRRLRVRDEPVTVHALHIVDGDLFLEVVLNDVSGSRDAAVRLAQRILALVRGVREKAPWTGQSGLDALPALRSALRGKRWDLRWRATRNLGRLLDRNAEVRGDLERMLADDSPHVRLAAVRALGIKGVDDKDWEVRLAALDKRTAIAALKDPHPALRAKALEIAERKVSASALERLLRDPDPAVVRQAADAASWKRRLPPTILPALIDASRADDPRTRRYAVRAMGKVVGDKTKAITELARHVDDDRAAIRSRAIETLGELLPAATAARAQVVKRLKDDDKSVREAAAEFIVKAGPFSTTEGRVLLRIMDATKSARRELNFARALWRARQLDSKTATKIAITALRKESWLVDDAAELLAEIGPGAAEQAMPALLGQIAHKHASTRRAVYLALASFGPAAREAIPALEERVQKESTKRTRDSARHALARIRGEDD